MVFFFSSNSTFCTFLCQCVPLSLLSRSAQSDHSSPHKQWLIDKEQKATYRPNITEIVPILIPSETSSAGPRQSTQPLRLLSSKLLLGGPLSSTSSVQSFFYRSPTLPYFSKQQPSQTYHSITPPRYQLLSPLLLFYDGRCGRHDAGEVVENYVLISRQQRDI